MKLYQISLVMLLSLFSLGSVTAYSEEFAVTVPGPPVSVWVDPSREFHRDECTGLRQNHDNSFENAYTWVYSGVIAPEFGAFAEQFEGNCNLCEIQLYLTQIGNQSDQTMDVMIWQDDHTGNPGELLLHLTDIDPGPIAIWPEVTRVDIPVSLVVDDTWWIGWWGNWPGETAGWLCAADEDGAGGEPRTKVAPGIGYPSGWDHPDIVPSWANAKSLGIQVWWDNNDMAIEEGNSWEGTSLFKVESISPNPFKRATEIRFANQVDGSYQLAIYDVGGRLLKTLVDGHVEQGNHTITWDGTDDHGQSVADGVYYVKGDLGVSGGVRRIIRIR